MTKSPQTWCKTKDKIFSQVYLGKVLRECEHKCNSGLVPKDVIADSLNSIPFFACDFETV